MRILHIIDNLNLLGGAQKMQVLFAQVAQSYNIDLTILSLQDNRHDPTLTQQLQQLDVRLLTYPAPTMLSPARLWRITRFLRQERFDIIHTNLTHANIVGTLAGRLAGIPVVAGLRNARVQPSRFHTIRYGLETLVLRYLANKVMAVGHATANSHRARLGRKCIEAIPNAVIIPEPLSTTDRTVVRAELLSDPAQPLVISVGRLTAQKGYKDLLNAMAELRQHHPSAVLVIVGEGELRSELANQIVQLGLQDHAKLLGKRTDVPRLLAASDVFVSASHWEGLSNAILEAMAAGLPVVATDVSDTPQVVVEGTGLVVPPHDPPALARAVCSLLDDPAPRQALGAAAKTHVGHHHDPAIWANKMLNLYQSILSDPPDSTADKTQLINHQAKKVIER